jgi:tight adherence protein B
MLLLVCFVVLFAAVLLAVSLGLKYFEARRKKQVTSMLQTASGEPVVTITKLLKDLEADKPKRLERLMGCMRFAGRARTEMQQAGLGWSFNKLLAAMALLFMPGVGLGLVMPVLLNRALTATVLGAILAVLPYVYVRKTRARRMAAMEEMFPEALDFLARSMRAGHAFTISLEMVGEETEEPLGQEFRTLFNEQNLGAPLDVALRNFSARVPLFDVRFFCTAVLLQRQTGGNLSEILQRLAYIIRERFRLKGQVKAASAHGRMTASVLLLLPICTAAGLLMVAPEYLRMFANDPDGKWLIGVAIGLQVVGHFAIKRIISIKV